jgi:hypothetical protein
MTRPRHELLEDEWLMVRHSGEIPEIALHATLYHLREDLNGPRLQLSTEEIQQLQEAAKSRYLEIILRDLCYENSKLSIYRGLRRAIFNWSRFVSFCRRQDATCYNLHRQEIAEALLTLLNKAVQTTDNDVFGLIFNCTFNNLALFAQELGISRQQLPEGIHLYCHEAVECNKSSLVTEEKQDIDDR